MPRVTKLTPDLRRHLCTMIAVGCSRRVAAEQLGLPESTVRNQAARDPDFAEELRQSEEARVFAPLHHLRGGGPRNWRSSAKFLERLNPQTYARPRNTGATEGQLAATLEEFAHDLLQKLRKQANSPRLRAAEQESTKNSQSNPSPRPASRPRKGRTSTSVEA